ncbi:MAG: hypothetical protein WKG01_23625 [Kofleriaceae bacterium]
MTGVIALALALAIAACGPRQADPPTLSPVAPPPPIDAPVMSMVTSIVVLDECPDAKHLDSKRTSREIQELIGPCTRVPGGGAHFSATLSPDGRVELASPSGDPGGGVVPTCVVQQLKQLRHKLALKSPCRFDVILDER